MTGPDYLTRARAILAAATPGRLVVRRLHHALAELRLFRAKGAWGDLFADVVSPENARALTLSRNAIEALLDEHEALAAYVAIGGSGCTGEGAPACEHCQLHDAHERAAAVLREET